MGLFDDKAYQNMDDISKMIEPWDSPFDDIIKKLPDEVEIPHEYILSYYQDLSLDQSIMTLIYRTHLTTDEIKILESAHLISRYYNYQKGGYVGGLYEPRIEETLEVNPIEGTVKGRLFYTKVNVKVDESTILKLLCEYVDRSLFSNIVQVSFLKELQEALTGDKTRKLRRYEVSERVKDDIKEILSEDKFRIRSYYLALKFIRWCGTYATTGNTASMANIMKLKIMSHSGRAIYSIEEEV